MNLKSLAHHEAGHAVIGRALGLHVGKVSVERDGNFAGYAFVDHDAEDAESVRASILSSLAGGFAEAKYRGVEWDVFQHSADPTHGESGDLEDFEHDIRVYARLTGLSVRAAEPILFQEAEQLVETHWREIQRLARYLIECGAVEYPVYGGNPRLPLKR